jgi:hypothetical protein
MRVEGTEVIPFGQLQSGSKVGDVKAELPGMGHDRVGIGSLKEGEEHATGVGLTESKQLVQQSAGDGPLFIHGNADEMGIRTGGGWGEQWNKIDEETAIDEASSGVGELGKVGVFPGGVGLSFGLGADGGDALGVGAIAFVVIVGVSDDDGDGGRMSEGQRFLELDPGVEVAVARVGEADHSTVGKVALQEPWQGGGFVITPAEDEGIAKDPDFRSAMKGVG